MNTRHIEQTKPYQWHRVANHGGISGTSNFQFRAETLDWKFVQPKGAALIGTRKWVGVFRILALGTTYRLVPHIHQLNPQTQASVSRFRHSHVPEIPPLRRIPACLPPIPFCLLSLHFPYRGAHRGTACGTIPRETEVCRAAGEFFRCGWCISGTCSGSKRPKTVRLRRGSTAGRRVRTRARCS